MPLLFIALIVFVIVLFVILAAGVGLGFLLNVVFPSIDLGAATIAGVIAFIGAIVAFVLMVAATKSHMDEDEHKEEEAEEDMLSRQIELFMTHPRSSARKRRKPGK